jgi:hypothetical protein
LAIEWGPPLFVPAASLTDEWTVRAVNEDRSNGHRSIVEAVVLGNAGPDEWLDIRTLAERRDTPQTDVANVLCGSVGEEIVLPLTLTVSQRTVVARVDGEPVEFEVLETSESWRAVAEVDGRTITAASRQGAFTPENLALERVIDIAALPASRFP